MMNTKRQRLLFSPLIIISLLIAPLVKAATIYTGKVVAITDGDTIKILTADKKLLKVRLANIDTPEKKQAYGQKAKQILSDKIYNKSVEVEKVTIDRYKRLVGNVYFQGRYINAEMVADGAAWVYRKYNKDPSMLRLEQMARDQKKGLWALQDDQRIAPWKWRKQRKKTNSVNKTNGHADL